MGSPLRTFKMFVPDLIATRTTDGKMRIEGVGSSTIRDHHGDSFTQKALRKMADSSLGMTVFMNHGYEVPKDVFGKIEKVRIQKTGIVDPRTKQEIWDLRLGIIVASSNPLAVQNFDLIEKDEVGLGISIGAMLPEGGYAPDKEAGGRLLIDDVDPVEFSMVGIPASPRAFVDYAVKSIVGVYPDSRKFAMAWERFKAAAETPEITASDDELDITNDVEPVEADETPARELEPSEITASADDEAFDYAAGVIEQRDLEPGEKLNAAPTPEGITAEPIPGPGEDHLDLGEPLEKAVHPDIEKGKKTHQHPHAHTHGHEHTHGYGDSTTVHSHDHAHQHSHDHGPDHEHEDDQNNYEHNHPHNGSWSDEEHAHGDGAVKSDKDLEAAVTPLAKSHKVTIWEDGDGNRTTEVNIGRKAPSSNDDQSVQDSLSPDTTGGQVVDTGGDEVISAAKALVKASNDTAGTVLKAVLGQLEASKASELLMKSERDLAIKVAKQAMDGTRIILERVAMLPAGRKTTDFVAIKDDFGDLSSSLTEIYDEDVRKSMFSKRS